MPLVVKGLTVSAGAISYPPTPAGAGAASVKTHRCLLPRPAPLPLTLAAWPPPTPPTLPRLRSLADAHEGLADAHDARLGRGSEGPKTW